MGKKPPDDDAYETIFVTHYRHPKTGKVIRARDYGKKVFPLKVRKGKAKRKKSQ